MKAKLAVAPVKQLSMDRVVAERIRNAITKGTFRPGSRLTEANLAETLAVSRGTVRAGLHRLLSEGLVVLRPYSGWHVPTLDARDAWELYTLRGCLEPLASRLAAENINDENVEMLMAAFKKLKAAVKHADDKEITDADLAIHKTIVALAGHKRLAAHYELVEQQVQIYIASSNAMLKKRTQVVENHRALVEAICAGKPKIAERLAREHGVRAASELFQILTTERSDFAMTGVNAKF